jgi:hypothetical protein
MNILLGQIEIIIVEKTVQFAQQNYFCWLHYGAVSTWCSNDKMTDEK